MKIWLLAWGIGGWEVPGEAISPPPPTEGGDSYSFSGAEINIFWFYITSDPPPSHVKWHLFPTHSAGSYFRNPNTILIWTEGRVEKSNLLCQEQFQGKKKKNEISVSQGTSMESWNIKRKKERC